MSDWMSSGLPPCAECGAPEAEIRDDAGRVTCASCALRELKAEPKTTGVPQLPRWCPSITTYGANDPN